MDKFEIRRIALKALVDSLGKGGQAAIASKTGIAPDYISRALYPEGKKGKKRIGEGIVDTLNEHYPNWLISNSIKQISLHEKQTNEVPLVSWVKAGGFNDVTDWLADEDVKVSTSYKARKHTFALLVDGHSMEPRFPDGCTIIVEPEEKAINGSYVIVRQNGDQEATFKQLVIEGGIAYLKALNPDWPKRIIEMMPDAVIIGVVKKMEMDV